MPGVARKTDICTGHDGFIPRANSSWSPDVFVNGLNVHRQGDSWLPHIKPDNDPHDGALVSGSPTVFTNGKQTARCGDPISCGSKISTCSSDTFAGDLSFAENQPPIDPETNEPMVFAEGYGETDYGNLDDEPDTDDGLNIYPPVHGTPTITQTIRSSAISTFPTNNVEENNEIPPEAEIPPVIDCTGIPEIVPPNIQLTDNFNLRAVTTNGAISNYPLKAQHGLSEQQIACNLLAWCQNLGEAIKSQHGSFTITSGFRHGGGKSQHERGQACDIQFPGKTNTEIYNISIWIRDTLNYDQLILEYGGNRPWIHVSYNNSGNRSISQSNKFGTRISAGNYKWGSLVNMV